MMRRFLLAIFAAMTLAVCVAPSTAQAAGHTTAYTARHAAIGDDICRYYTPGACDPDRNNEKSRLQALGWCISGNEYYGAPITGNDYTRIWWQYYTCKGYVIFVQFTLYYTSSTPHFYDLMTSEIFPQ